MDTIVSDAERAERALAIGYARAADRPALAALFALDDALAGVLRTTREPIVGQMRLTWWHDALTRLDRDPAPAEPTLCGLKDDVVSRGISGAALAQLVEGWEVLVDAETLETDVILRFSELRGGALFRVAATVLALSAKDPVDEAGRGWALADLARHVSDQAVATTITNLAKGPLDLVGSARWSRNGRPLGALAHLARMDLQVPPDRPRAAGSPRRLGRLLWHRATGR